MAAVEPLAAPSSASRKRRSKGQYSQVAKRARPGAALQLEPGMCGILITCNMNERKCVAEAYSLLGEYGEQLYGPEQVGFFSRLLATPSKVHCAWLWRFHPAIVASSPLPVFSQKFAETPIKII